MQLNCEELKLESLIKNFYTIPGVPSKAVKPEQLRLEYHKVFIQSTSQGSRCLKKKEERKDTLSQRGTLSCILRHSHNNDYIHNIVHELLTYNAILYNNFISL